MDNNAKRWIFSLLSLVLLAPILQYHLAFVKSGRLYGWFVNAPDVDFSWKTWMDGSYGEAKAKYVNDAMGFRPDLVRLNNQIYYTAFGKLRSSFLVLGRDHCLFEKGHIDAYNGKDFIGRTKIIDNVRKLKAIQDTLARLGKTFILIQAPGKAFYYPELIPAPLLKTPRDSTNYSAYSRVADSLGINQIDFNKWFVAQKPICTESLYPKQGTHWSLYGALLACDSLVRYMEQARHITMSHPAWTKVLRTHDAIKSDNDIALTLNLILPLSGEVLTYPGISYPIGATLVKPKVVYIGDSFLFQWKTLGLLDNTNTDWQIWYYFNSIYGTYTPELQSDHPITDKDFINGLASADCIVVLYTASNLADLGNGFIEKAYHHYYPAK